MFIIFNSLYCTVHNEKRNVMCHFTRPMKHFANKIVQGYIVYISCMLKYVLNLQMLRISSWVKEKDDARAEMKQCIMVFWTLEMVRVGICFKELNKKINL